MALDLELSLSHFWLNLRLLPTRLYSWVSRTCLLSLLLKEAQVLRGGEWKIQAGGLTLGLFCFLS